MDQPHVSILEGNLPIAQSLARTLQAEGFAAGSCGSAMELMV
jgi:hypothetical protein